MNTQNRLQLKISKYFLRNIYRFIEVALIQIKLTHLKQKGRSPICHFLEFDRNFGTFGIGIVKI